MRRVGDRLSLLGMGDLEYWRWLEEMAREPYPLLRKRGDAPFPDYTNPAPGFRATLLELTRWGREALAGAVDWHFLQGSEYWLGGLQVHSGMAWRWDRRDAALISLWR